MLVASKSTMDKFSVCREVQGSVPWDGSSSEPSLIPPPSVSATFHRVHVIFSSQFGMPSSSKSPESSILVGSVSFSSTIPFPFRSSSPSSNWSSSVLLSLGSLAKGGSPYCPLTSTPSLIPSPSVSGEVGSVSKTSASYESLRPSPSVSFSWGSVEVIPSTSAVKIRQPPGPKSSTGLQGDSVAVMLRGPGRKYWVGGVVDPFLVPQAGLMNSFRLTRPSPSGSPDAPS